MAILTQLEMAMLALLQMGVLTQHHMAILTHVASSGYIDTASPQMAIFS